ncbi:MAG: hypothetical protein UHN88_08175 [Eubacterium sp.]|nr:hypothetical protein [Eubacterium sp.]
MSKKQMAVTVIVLMAISVLIYGLQIVIFHDVRTTEFYIMQDLAFMPFTIAIATIVVGELIGRREKKERTAKTRMLTSSFFTELGEPLLHSLLRSAEFDEEMRITLYGEDDDRPVKEMTDRIRRGKISIDLCPKVYNETMQMLVERQTALLVLSSNPMLFEQECFTDMLWGLFHLIDEYRLRGIFEEMSEESRAHMNEDFERVLRLLLENRASNIKYLKDTFPNFYGAAKQRIAEIQREN